MGCIYVDRDTSKNHQASALLGSLLLSTAPVLTVGAAVSHESCHN